MFKSFLAALLLVAAIFVAPTVNAQQAGQTASILQGCDNHGCMYYIYQWQPSPNGQGGEWVVVQCVWIPGPHNEAAEPIE